CASDELPTLFSPTLLGRITSVQWQSEFREDRIHHETAVEGLPGNCGPTDRTPNLPEDWKHREGDLQSVPRNCRARDRGPMPRLRSNQSADRLALPRCGPPDDGDFSGVSAFWLSMPRMQPGH